MIFTSFISYTTEQLENLTEGRQQNIKETIIITYFTKNKNNKKRAL